ncbi:hypothetical protein [Chryseobacterium wangxinyae]|uniref:hypothetical protein n=1 Tax=Chryseobacterium sp. CY353 TaxID=2997334 RepID=UPI0022702342|nr:hypothetical protein [Chryseobacterium sp. CY353]MCY0970190.1 hypothetical protein [Chryseobacterium sp. CY353]
MKSRYLLVFTYLYAIVFSILKTLRLPNDWAEAHWMLDYRFGFIKRGLAGEIFGLLSEKTEFSILVLSGGILLILYLFLIFTAIRNSIKNGSIQQIDFFFYTLFFLSQYIIFSAHLIGYMDHLIFLLTIATIYLVKKKLFVLSSAIMAIAIFIHELSFFLMIPLCFFTFIYTNISNQILSLKDIFKKIFTIKTIGFLILPCASLIVLSIFQESNINDLYSKIYNYLENIKFISRNSADSVASAYTGKFSYYFWQESKHLFQRLFISKCSILYGIPILFMMFLIYKKFHNVNIYLMMILAICVLFPLLLHSIAYDTFRIWSYPFMTLFLAFWILNSSKNSIDSSINLSKFHVIIFIFSISLVSLSSNVLFDGEKEHFTFLQRILLFIPVLAAVLLYLKNPKKIF